MVTTQKIYNHTDLTREFWWLNQNKFEFTRPLVARLPPRRCIKQASLELLLGKRKKLSYPEMGRENSYTLKVGLYNPTLFILTTVVRWSG